MIFLQTEKEKAIMVQKKILASTLMALILTSQLMGCGSDAAPQKETIEPMETTVSTEIQTTEVQMDDVEPTVETVEEATEPTLTRPVNKEDETTEVVETETSVYDGTYRDNMLKNGEITQEEYDNIDKEVNDLLSASEAEQMKWMYENGFLSAEAYKELMDELKNGSSKKKESESIIVSEPTHVPGILPEGWTDADPSKDENITYDDVVLPEHLQGKWL